MVFFRKCVIVYYYNYAEVLYEKIILALGEYNYYIEIWEND